MSLTSQEVFQLYSLGAGGIIVIVALKQLFGYLAKKKNGNHKDILTKTDHQIICDTKMDFIKRELDNIRDETRAIRQEMNSRLDEIYSILTRIGGKI